MRKLYSCLFYGLCVFAIVFSLYWMMQPKLTLPAPSAGEQPISSQANVLAQAMPEQTPATVYYLCDDGGRVAVYENNGGDMHRIQLTSIYVNLLPEGDALRIKNGLTVYSEKELDALLEDLGD